MAHGVGHQDGKCAYLPRVPCSEGNAVRTSRADRSALRRMLTTYHAERDSGTDCSRCTTRAATK
ncbi:hypothetical protein DZD52_14005 [Xanthomonas nasturtii]|uniref:Uncharacterized protein n=1 Tax=Xanthomonas nasturtii TaxID=1843581 RepID=A0A3E1KHI2_9XANT|nr:hypothetical protein DZD52_14005 [Xanthomonas nasturtii]